MGDKTERSCRLKVFALFILSSSCIHCQMIRSAYPKRQYVSPQDNPDSEQPRLKKSGINYTNDFDKDQSIVQNFFHFHNRPIVKYYYTCVSFIIFDMNVLLLLCELFLARLYFFHDFLQLLYALCILTTCKDLPMYSLD